ncbi:toll-like receptor 5 [Cuculus canorus]|uniref:toll-like receptor 5 n=1 Tax=Cuculus canorus TaxID=55661 RepID=UPI0023AB233F|nr:toll-like receptor 5 [Cuculus canorus]XP_053919170.1 toll-like receptor 5 [Cuculus canorus]XP_053919171.1 toll-like receptor 5 [Cuculus canorus]XP_053919173.1 toll-like receptor 5 [Cuculus canorus]XP_053919174.1 toll-like receptor 5 [Cuculus canorus]
MMLRQQLILVFGISLVSCICALRKCYSEAQVSHYYFCNLTDIPLVPKDTVKLLLTFNYIRQVTATSFPLLEHLLVLEIGTQYVYPVTIGKEAFRNLPNLRVLDLGFNKILELDLDAFVGLSRLTVLRLFQNCLGDSILEEHYFQDLSSLEELDLSGNEITKLQPHPLFYNLTVLKTVNLKFNKISNLCESNLTSFQGKHFLFFSLSSNHLYKTDEVVWAKCPNPFRNITFISLDLSVNGWNTEKVQYFCTAIRGTQIGTLIFSSHVMGSGFGFNNLKNPDNDTFVGLARSDLRLLDISKGYIFSLNSLIFQSLGNLELLNLFKNKINQIQRQAFFGLENLKILNLSSNLLGELYDYTFEGLHSVMYVDLQQNHIGMIGEKSFSRLLSLKIIDLRDNAIKKLPSFPHLISVFLGDNKITSVAHTAIAATHFELERNWLANLGDLYILFQVPDLQYIFLKQNRLSYCVKSDNVTGNSQLIYMDLGENMLQLVWERDLCLDVFGALSKLQVLHLNNNYLRALPQEIFRDLTSLKRLNLASNLLSHLSPGLFPQSLENLNLSGNQLFSPKPEVFMTLSILDITHNKYVCDCTLKSLLVWLNETNVTLAGSQSDRYCVYPPAFAGVPLSSLIYDDCDEEELQQALSFSVFILTSVTLLMFLMAVVIFTRCRGICFVWYKTITKKMIDSHPQLADNSEYRYDAYLCYSKNDFEWVQNSLLKHLDSQYFDKNWFNLCFEERDFLPGEEHINNIRDAIWNSRKTICIVTRQFLKDGWCLEAFNFAQSRYFCDLKDVLIMVVVGSLSQYQLMKHKPIRNFLQRSRYLRWPEDYQDVDWFLNNLSCQILKEKKVRREASGIELQTVATVSS